MSYVTICVANGHLAKAIDCVSKLKLMMILSHGNYRVETICLIKLIGKQVHLNRWIISMVHRRCTCKQLSTIAWTLLISNVANEANKAIASECSEH